MAARRPLQLLLSSEHGTNHVPGALGALFTSRAGRVALQSHRGWDPGSLWLAQRLSRRFSAPLFAARVSRLVIDPNRSSGHPRLFSEFTAPLPARTRSALEARYHASHHAAVRACVATLSSRGPVLHVALHSFTPVWDGAVRRTDLGLLYDPRRHAEKALAHDLAVELKRQSGLTIHKNAPYRGIADGLPTCLRRIFDQEKYIGLEFEMNQRLATKDQLATVAALLGDALEVAPTSSEIGR